MTSMNRGKLLHDRRTRGNSLTKAEERELNDWYDQMDAAEAETVRIPSSTETDSIDAQIDATLAEIQSTTRSILSVSRANHEVANHTIAKSKERGSLS